MTWDSSQVAVGMMCRERATERNTLPCNATAELAIGCNDKAPMLWGILVCHAVGFETWPRYRLRSRSTHHCITLLVLRGTLYKSSSLLGGKVPHSLRCPRLEPHGNLRQHTPAHGRLRRAPLAGGLRAPHRGTSYGCCSCLCSCLL